MHYKRRKQTAKGMKVARAQIKHNRHQRNDHPNEVQQAIAVNSTNWKSTFWYDAELSFICVLIFIFFALAAYTCTCLSSISSIIHLFIDYLAFFPFFLMQRIKSTEACLPMLFIERRFLWTEHHFIRLCSVADHSDLSQLDVHTASGKWGGYRQLYCNIFVHSIRNDLGKKTDLLAQNVPVYFILTLFWWFL